MELHELRYILAVAEEQNISKASEKLFIAQPTLSQIIKKVENRIGHDLFTRSSSGLKLTYAGEKFINLTKQMLELKCKLDSELQDVALSNSGRIMLGISSLWGSYILPMVLMDFHKKYPNVQIVIKDATPSRLEDMLLKEDIDVAVMPLPIASEEIEYTELFKEQLLLAVSPDNELSKKGVSINGKKHQLLDANLLKDQPFILFHPGLKLRDSADNFFRAYNFQPKVVTYATSIEFAKRLAASNLGVSFIPASFAHSFTSPPNPVYFCLDEIALPKWTLVAACKTRRYHSNLTNDLMKTFKKVFITE